MKLIISDWEQHEFEIVQISWETDEKGDPIDIVIIANKETLDEIANFAMYGYNCNENSMQDQYGNVYSEALYARIRGNILLPDCQRIYAGSDLHCMKCY